MEEKHETKSIEVEKQYEEMKEFKSFEQIVESLKNKEDRPLSFSDEEMKLASAFFNSNNYFSFAIYRKLLPRKEDKQYNFTDCLNLYNFNSFLRENLTRFTGHIELMLRATLIQQICDYYEKKKAEDKVELSVKVINDTVELRKSEIIKKIIKTANKRVSVTKLSGETAKKLHGSIKSIVDTAEVVAVKYSKELGEYLGTNAEESISSLVNLVKLEALKGIKEIRKVAIETLKIELDKLNLEDEIYASIIEDLNKKEAHEQNMTVKIDSLSQAIICAAPEWDSYNLFNYKTGEVYLDLAIYKRNDSESIEEAKEIIEFFKSVIEDSKSDAINHYKKKGSGIPFWVLMEELTYGNVYRFANSINSDFENAWISNSFDGQLKDYILGWFRTINFLRNKCAHYTRLYGTYFSISPPSLLKEDIRGAGITANENKTLFANMLTIKNLLKFHVSGSKEWNDFIDKLDSEINNYSEVIRISEMGFPENWKECLYH